MSTILQLNEVSLTYTTKTILHQVTQDIHFGDFIVVKGQNGSGKTSLLRLMAGLLPPTSGKIVRNHPLTIGYLPQRKSIDREFPITVAETVLSGLNCRKPFWRNFRQKEKETAQAVMEQFGLSEIAQMPIGSLSGGQWQRTLLARSIVGNPDLLLLDEPDTHLDVEMQNFLQNFLERENRQRTLVIVSHNDYFLSKIPVHRCWQVQEGKVREHCLHTHD